MPPVTGSEASFHDNLVYGLHLVPPEPDRDLWRSDLLLDIDHIVEWVCGADGGCRFLVAPATLAFHDVHDLRIDVDFGGGPYSASIVPLSIHDITRTQADHPSAAVPVAFYRWRIALNSPDGGSVTFGASGLTLDLRAEPALIDEQSLPPSTRPPMRR